MTEGRVPPTLPSFKIPNLPNEPQNIPGVAFPNRYVQVFPQTDKAHQSGFPHQQKNITQNTFHLLHPPLSELPPFHSAPYQNASQWSQFVPEHPSSVPPVLVQGTAANSNDTFQTDLPDYHFHSQQRNRSELNLLDVENKVHLLSSYTHETAHDIAGIRPTSMYKNNNPAAPSSSTANSTITEPRVFRNESKFSLDCMSINFQKENQTGYKKDNLSVVPKRDYIGEIISPKGLGIFTASNSILGEMENEVYSLAPLSNEVKGLVDNLTDWPIGIQKNDLPSESDKDASSIENLKSNRDKMKLLNDMSQRMCDAIPQTVEDLLNDLIQESGELPGQIDEAAGCNMQVNNPQYFHVSRSKSYTDCALQIPQEDTETVTQKLCDAVTNDQINEMSNSNNKAYNMQEDPSTQNLVIREVQTNSPRLESFLSDCVDSTAPSESLILGLDISHELDGEILPQQDVDKSNEANSPLEDTFGVEKASATKEVMRTAREMIEETDEHEDKGTENDSDTSREKETNRVQSKQMMDQQTQPESTVAVKMGPMTTEMLEFNTSLEVGNGSRVEEMTSAGRLCTSEAELGRDGCTENTESEQHKHNSYSNDQVGVEKGKNKVLDSIKKIETKTSGIVCESECDRVKTPRPKGRMKVEMENETARSSAVVQTLIMQKPIERDSIFKTEHRRLARQSPKKAETDLFGRKEKNQKTVVKARDGSGGHQESRINKEERQTPRRSERIKNAQSYTIFVMNTRTRRDLNSLISEDVARTQKVKKTENPNSETDGDTKPPLVEGMKNTQAPDLKSGSNSDIVTGRGTRGKVDVAFVKEKKSSKGDHIYRRSYKTRQHHNMATLEKQVGDRKEGAGTTRCSKQTRKCNLCFKGSVKNSSGDTELRSEKTTREGSPEAEEAAVKCSERKEGELKHTPKKHDSAFPVTTEKVKEIKKEESRGKKEPKYEQHKAKDCSGDKRSDKRHTRSYIASLQCQVENKGEEIRESYGRNKGKNQIKESGVKMVLRERPQKEERVNLKEVRNKDAGITRHTVAGSTKGETRKQEMTTGILTSINQSILEQNIGRQRKKPRPASNAKTMHGRTLRSESEELTIKSGELFVYGHQGTQTRISRTKSKINNTDEVDKRVKRM